MATETQASLDLSSLEKEAITELKETVEKEPEAFDKGEEKNDLTNIVAKHYNQLEERGLKERSESRIYHLRNFNNWMKSMLIGEYIKKVHDQSKSHDRICVLDIGAGKGGDLLKWKKGKIDHLVCSDIASTSLEQLEQRFKDMKEKNSRGRYEEKIFTLECIPADCTKERLKNKYKDENMKFDLASTQFSFHYCFESIAQAECMIQNASECLKEGGFFIGTTPNALDIVNRLNSSKNLSFGNDVFSVTFESKENLPLFGAKYDFHLEGVVDCPEFLVYFPAFVEIASRFGLKLLFKKTFEEVFEDFHNTRDGKSLLSVMHALECYPPLYGKELVGKEEDYEETKKRLREESTKHASDRRTLRAGTLSQQEWEACSLYIAFAFVKESVTKT